MAGKVDRRVRKTKSQLREGLARLMLQKSIKEITVKELVDEVDINRSTFYLHYTDIYQMLQQIEEDALKEITQVMQNYTIDSNNTEGAFYFIVQFFNILDSNKELCLALLGPHGDMAFVERIEKLIAGTFLSQLPETVKMITVGDRTFILNGCVGLIRTWLTEPEQKSAEHMAALTYKMIESTTQGYLEMLKK